MATSAPTGTATRPPSTSATPHGRPWSTVNCENATAPIAANAAWHRDTWPDMRTSRPSESSIRAVTSPVVKNASSSPTNEGTSTSGTSSATAAAARTAPGARYCNGGRASTRDGGTRRRPRTTSTTNRTRKGRAAGRPESQAASRV